mmetsp:Transcript_42595/g.68431  ORF Transcript_42595/g.68431 Transcript_42595/m.68431 type:complete len:85 (-) Transcript_42595:16-270(-)
MFSFLSSCGRNSQKKATGAPQFEKPVNVNKAQLRRRNSTQKSICVPQRSHTEKKVFAPAPIPAIRRRRKRAIAISCIRSHPFVR